MWLDHRASDGEIQSNRRAQGHVIQDHVSHVEDPALYQEQQGLAEGLKQKI